MAAAISAAPGETSRNLVTAWWDASQIYGFDERSRGRVKRDPQDPAKLLMVAVPGRAGAGDRYGYLPTFARCAAGSRAARPIRSSRNGPARRRPPSRTTGRSG